MASWISRLIFATLFISGACGYEDHPIEPGRLLQESPIPKVGIFFTSRTMAPAMAYYTGSSSTIVQDDIVKNFEGNDRVTAVGEVTVGELVCDTLVEAEDAPELQFSLGTDQTIIAQKILCTTVGGAAFSDGIGRKDLDKSSKRNIGGDAPLTTVAMVWGEFCDAQMLKTTAINADRSTSVTRTLPCDVGFDLEMCIVEFELDFQNVFDIAEPIEETEPTRGLRRGMGAVEGRKEEYGPDNEVSPRGRKLQGTTEVSVMFLFSDQALEAMFLTEQQIETSVLEVVAKANEGMSNSEIDLVYTLVYVGPLPYDEGDVTTSTSISMLRQNAEVGALRDQYGADLVQLIGRYTDNYCGRGYMFRNGRDDHAFSNIDGFCIDSLSSQHEFGHNFGCFHNRDDAGSDDEYAHGYRYCEGEDRYRTVMSYPCPNLHSSPVNLFSNPDVEYLGKPTGTPTENCARKIRENMVIVSDYRSDVISGSVEASVRTTVSTRANAWDEKTSNDGGCDPDGCLPSLARDLVVAASSRWSCKRSLLNQPCKLHYHFGKPQNIVRLRVAFYKGGQRTRSFEVRVLKFDGSRESSEYTSSGETDDFEDFELESTGVRKIYIIPISPNSDDWLSITEVKIMVE